MKKLILFLALLLPLAASAQIPAANDTTLYSGSTAFTPQFRFKNVTLDGVSYRIPQVYNSLLAKYDTYVTSKYLRAFYAPLVSGGYVPLSDTTGAQGYVKRWYFTNQLAGKAPIVTYTANAIYKGNGTTTPVVSTLTDNGTLVSTTIPFETKSGGAGVYLGNGGGFGTIHASDITSKFLSNANIWLRDDYTVLNTGTNGGEIDLQIGFTPKVTVLKDSTYIWNRLRLNNVNSGSTADSLLTISNREVKKIAGNSYIQNQNSVYQTADVKINGSITGNYITVANGFIGNLQTDGGGTKASGQRNTWFKDGVGGTIMNAFTDEVDFLVPTHHKGALIETAKSTYGALEYMPKQRTDSLYAPISGGGTYINNGTSVQSSSNYNIDGLGTVTKAAIATTPTDAILLTNTTAAALGAQQISPSLHFKGNAWNTTGSASESADFINYVVPVQGTTPTSNMLWQSARAGGGYTTALTLSSAGNLTMPSQVTSGTARFNGNIGINAAPSASSNVLFQSSITGATTARGLDLRGAFQSGVTSVGYMSQALMSTAAASFTLGDAVGYGARFTSIGAGSTVTRATGFWAEAALTGATNNYGFRGSLGLSGTANWNIWVDGLAPSFLASELLIGNSTPTAGNEKLQVTGSASISNTLLVANAATAGSFVKTGSTSSKFLFGDGSDGTALPSGTTAAGTLNLKNYTVATLPAGTQGDIAYVTDATAPTYLTTVVGGGAVVTPVFYNGANWVAH